MFNPNVTIATTRSKIESGEIANLTNLTGAELSAIKKNGDYVAILQNVNNDAKVVDREVPHLGHTQKWERVEVRVFYSIKEMERFLDQFYKRERFIINALPQGWLHDELDEFIKTMPYDYNNRFKGETI